uniref:Phosphatidylinositol 3-kinase catalytic subunit type 3 n=1 Tax=Plectus sambesii TaxID=2011161 RepID=A0A914WFW2_9BILA
MSSSQFLYVYSCDLDANVTVKIGSLEGKLDKPTFDELSRDPSLEHCVALQRQGTDGVHHPPQDLFVTCSVFCDGKAVGFPVSTSYKCLKSRWNWNEWLTLPVKYNELSRDAQLAVSIWDLHDGVEPHCVGGTTLSLFSKRGVFRCGIIDLKVWPFRESDGSVPTSTPGKIKTRSGGADTPFDEEDGSPEMRRLSKLSKKHRAGLIEKVDWLDRLTFREIETINEREKRQTRSLFLMLEFPRVHADNADHAIVYYERNGDELFKHKLYPNLVTCPDPEIGLDNLVEAKHHVLTRSARSGAIDRELKPNAVARDALERVVQAPSSRQLSSEQRDLIWKFRFYLSGNKKALTKFLRSVNWEEEQEARQATDLLKEWAAIDSEDALELLSPTFTYPSVRRYAVSRLTHAAPEDLLLYLLQLVQALKYENFSSIESGTDASFIQDITSSWWK